MVAKHKTEVAYFVVYRSGGTHSCRWTRLLDRYTLVEANAKRDELVKMGYAAMSQSAHQIETIGMPYGWSHDSVDWDKDEIINEHDRRGLIWRTTHNKSIAT